MGQMLQKVGLMLRVANRWCYHQIGLAVGEVRVAVNTKLRLDLGVTTKLLLAVEIMLLQMMCQMNSSSMTVSVVHSWCHATLGTNGWVSERACHKHNAPRDKVTELCYGCTSTTNNLLRTNLTLCMCE